jgi:hypothetical protein
MAHLVRRYLFWKDKYRRYKMGRGRPSNIKSSVNGMPLKEFLIRSLVNSTYRQLIKNKTFVAKTGIKSSGNLRNICQNFGIFIEDIYQYGREKGLIPYDETFNQWVERTRGKHYKKSKTVLTREVYAAMGKEIGLIVDDTMEDEVIKMTLLDFMTVKDFNDAFRRIESELKKA